jgi:hypothetical protein
MLRMISSMPGQEELSRMSRWSYSNNNHDASNQTPRQD